MACDGPLRAFIAWKYGHYGRDFLNEVALCTHESVYRRLAEYDPERGGFMTWVRLLARNAARAVVRQRYGKRFRPFVAMESYDCPASVPGPADEYELARTGRILRDALAVLPKDSRRALELCCEKGLTTQEAADVLGVSQPTVSRKRSRGLAVLRKRLLERDARIVERDTTRMLGWEEPDVTGYGDDWTATVGALLPDDPPPLHDRAAKDEREEEAPE